MDLKTYIFLTAEGYTFQPNSESFEPDIENLQVIGLAEGENPDSAYKDLLQKQPFWQDTEFDKIFCYPLGGEYKEEKEYFYLKENN